MKSVMQTSRTIFGLSQPLIRHKLIEKLPAGENFFYLLGAFNGAKGVWVTSMPNILNYIMNKIKGEGFFLPL